MTGVTEKSHERLLISHTDRHIVEYHQKSEFVAFGFSLVVYFFHCLQHVGLVFFEHQFCAEEIVEMIGPDGLGKNNDHIEFAHQLSTVRMYEAIFQEIGFSAHARTADYGSERIEFVKEFLEEVLGIPFRYRISDRAEFLLHLD